MPHVGPRDRLAAGYDCGQTLVRQLVERSLALVLTGLVFNGLKDEAMRRRAGLLGRRRNSALEFKSQTDGGSCHCTLLARAKE